MELESEWPTAWGGLLRAPALRTDSQPTLLKTVFSKKKNLKAWNMCATWEPFTLLHLWGIRDSVLI